MSRIVVVMRFGIRLRFAAELRAALLPVGATAVFGRMETEVSRRLAVDLESLRNWRPEDIRLAIVEPSGETRSR